MPANTAWVVTRELLFGLDNNRQDNGKLFFLLEPSIEMGNFSCYRTLALLSLIPHCRVLPDPKHLSISLLLAFDLDKQILSYITLFI